MMSFGRRLVKWGSGDNSRIGGGEIIYEGSCTLVRKVVVLKSRKICRGMEKSAPEIFLKKSKNSLTPADSSILFSIPTATTVAVMGMFFTGLPLKSELI